MTVFFIISAVVALLAVLIIWQNRAIQLNELEIKSKRLPRAFDGYRILHISDLHNAELGEKNCKLLALAEQVHPDMIAITGDLIDRRRANIQMAAELAEKLVKIAPTYYVPGNHEARFDNYESLRVLLCSAGVTIMDNKSEKISLGGEEIVIAGVNDPEFSLRGAVCEENVLKKLLAEAFADVRQEQNTHLRIDKTEGAAAYGCDQASDNRAPKDDTLCDFDEKAECVSEHIKKINAKSTIYSVLLAHKPQFFDLYVKNGADLVLAGHVHGGQFRIPFIGGLFAPEQGFFPKYDSGIYKRGGARMFISRGLGNSKIPIRINNKPELAVICLKSAKSA